MPGSFWRLLLLVASATDNAAATAVAHHVHHQAIVPDISGVDMVVIAQCTPKTSPAGKTIMNIMAPQNSVSNFIFPSPYHT